MTDKDACACLLGDVVKPASGCRTLLSTIKKYLKRMANIKEQKMAVMELNALTNLHGYQGWWHSALLSYVSKTEHIVNILILLKSYFI